MIGVPEVPRGEEYTEGPLLNRDPPTGNLENRSGAETTPLDLLRASGGQERKNYKREDIRRYLNNVSRGEREMIDQGGGEGECENISVCNKGRNDTETKTGGNLEDKSDLVELNRMNQDSALVDQGVREGECEKENVSVSGRIYPLSYIFARLRHSFSLVSCVLI